MPCELHGLSMCELTCIGQQHPHGFGGVCIVHAFVQMGYHAVCFHFDVRHPEVSFGAEVCHEILMPLLEPAGA
jgi:hypothetical protein